MPNYIQTVLLAHLLQQLFILLTTKRASFAKFARKESQLACRWPGTTISMLHLCPACMSPSCSLPPSALDPAAGSTRRKPKSKVEGCAEVAQQTACCHLADPVGYTQCPQGRAVLNGEPESQRLWRPGRNVLCPSALLLRGCCLLPSSLQQLSAHMGPPQGSVGP